jgi:tetratricopeptide (TPR) repeat protein
MPLRRTTALIIAIVFAYSGVTSAQSYRDLATRADQARDAERLDEAADLYRKALALRPAWAEGWWSLGTIQYDKNEYPAAARSFRRLVAIQPKSGNALAMLGLSEFELGQDAQALKHIQASREVGLANDEQLRKVVLYHEGVLLQRAGKFESAQQTLEQLCLLGVDTDDVANALGMTLLRSTAKVPPTKEAKDSDVVLRVGRAECFAGQKKYEEGKKLFSEVVAENADYPNIHYAYGLFLEEMRDIKGAVSAYQEEIKHDPHDVFSRLRIAAATYKEDSATGLAYAEEAVKLNPSLPFGHYLLGLLLLDTDRFQGAIPELELARTAYPSDAKIYFALGSAYARAGRREDAARARARFAELNQKNGQSASADQD